MRGGILLLDVANALDMVQIAELRGVAVLGIDAFELSPNATQPIMDESIDFSAEREGSPGKRDCWTAAKEFLRDRMETTMFFEIVLNE